MLWLANALFGPRFEPEDHVPTPRRRAAVEDPTAIEQPTAVERRPALSQRELDFYRQRALAARAEAAGWAFRQVGHGFAYLGRKTLDLYHAGRRRGEIRRTVRELQALSDRQLQDIGVARADIPRLAAGLIDRYAGSGSALRGRRAAGPRGSKNASRTGRTSGRESEWRRAA